eukprot:a508764_1357.p1 GENE.a508764_1357~~a508764_1357.p1  ORF type:complete len:236 (-),score=97.51 a508764_1357:30-716(-)
MRAFVLAVLAIAIAAVAVAQMSPPELPEQLSANIVVFQLKEGQQATLFAGAYYVDVTAGQRRIDFAQATGVVASIYTSFDSEGKADEYQTVVVSAAPTNAQVCVQVKTDPNDTIWQKDSLDAFSFAGQTNFYGNNVFTWINNDGAIETTVYIDQQSSMPVGFQQYNSTMSTLDLVINFIMPTATVPDGIFTIPTFASGCPKQNSEVSPRSAEAVGSVLAAHRVMNKLI